MNYERFYSPRTRAADPVAIREVVDLIAGRDVISLAPGWPHPDCFPTEELERAFSACANDHPEELLQYGGTAGYGTLRTLVAERMRERHGIDYTAENVLVTAGSQQGLYLLAQALLGDGDEVVVGAPTYVAALDAFETVADVSYVAVPVDRGGISVDALERQLLEAEPTLAYVVPAFQNPTGVTLTGRRRERLVELAEEHDFLVIEDQPYHELRFGGEPVDPLASSNRQRVVYLGTFSKILAPGLRLGWVAADAELVGKLEVLKQPIDLHTNVVGQHVAARYLQTGTVDDHVDDICEFYAHKRDVAIDALTAEMPAGVSWTEPDGGMFLWLTVPESIDASALLEDAVANGVAYVPGYAFYPTDPERNTLRLSYSYPSDDELETGIRLLARTIREHAY